MLTLKQMSKGDRIYQATIADCSVCPLKSRCTKASRRYLTRIASDRVADHFTQRGLVVPLEFELDALGTWGMCWCKGTENDQGIADLLDSLR